MTRCCVGSYDLDSGMGAIGRPSASSVSVPKFSIGTADRFAYMGQYMSKKHAKSSSYFGRQSPGPATYNVRGGTNAKGIVTVSDTSGRTPPSYSFSGDVNRPSPFRVGGLPLSPAAAVRRLPCFPRAQAILTTVHVRIAVIAVTGPSLLPTDGLVQLPRERYGTLLPSAGVLLHG